MNATTRIPVDEQKREKALEIYIHFFGAVYAEQAPDRFLCWVDTDDCLLTRLNRACERILNGGTTRPAFGQVMYVYDQLKKLDLAKTQPELTDCCNHCGDSGVIQAQETPDSPIVDVPCICAAGVARGWHAVFGDDAAGPLLTCWDAKAGEPMAIERMAFVEQWHKTLGLA